MSLMDVINNTCLNVFWRWKNANVGEHLQKKFWNFFQNILFTI